MKVNKPSENSRVSLRDLRTVASLTVLLGLTWIMGFFSFGPRRVILIYPFTICNSLQGRVCLAVGWKGKIFKGNLIYVSLYIFMSSLQASLFLFSTVYWKKMWGSSGKHTWAADVWDTVIILVGVLWIDSITLSKSFIFLFFFFKDRSTAKIRGSSKRNSHVHSDSVESDSTTVKKISDSSKETTPTYQEAAWAKICMRHGFLRGPVSNCDVNSSSATKDVESYQSKLVWCV